MTQKNCYTRAIHGLGGSDLCTTHNQLVTNWMGSFLTRNRHVGGSSFMNRFFVKWALVWVKPKTNRNHQKTSKSSEISPYPSKIQWDLAGFGS